MLLEGKEKEFARVVRGISLRQTRRGQEIVSEKNWINDHSPERFVKMLLQARMEKVGKSIPTKIQKGMESAGETRTQRGQQKLDTRTKALKTSLDKKRLDVSEAQKILDSLICA